MAFSCPALSCCLCGISVSASFDGKQHLRSLPVVNSIGYVLRFLAKLCRSLLCDDLFSHQPFPRGSSGSEETQEKKEGRMESGRLCPSVFPVPAGGPRCPCPPTSSWELSCWRPTGGLSANRPSQGAVRNGQDRRYLDSPHPGCSGKRSL